MTTHRIALLTPDDLATLSGAVTLVFLISQSVPIRVWL